MDQVVPGNVNALSRLLLEGDMCTVFMYVDTYVRVYIKQSFLTLESLILFFCLSVNTYNSIHVHRYMSYSTYVTFPSRS